MSNDIAYLDPSVELRHPRDFRYLAECRTPCDASGDFNDLRHVGEHRVIE